MTETIFVQIREEVSHELCGCPYKDIPPEHEDTVDEEAYSRYNDWVQDEEDRLRGSIDDDNRLAQSETNKRIGL